MTMTLISTINVTVSTGVASLDFTSIPQTGTDLLIVLSARNRENSATTNLSINGSTTNFSSRNLNGSGSAAASGSTGGNQAYATQVSTVQTANTFSNASFYIPNYTSSANKSISLDTVIENNAVASQLYISAGTWANTAAITSFSISAATASGFAQYTTASLYTITKGSGGATVS